MKRKYQGMLSGPLFPNIVAYTVPIILTSLLQLLFNAADLVVVGRFCGSISLGAVSATGSLTTLLVNLFIGLSTGAGVTVAHAIGSREETSVHRTVHTALVTAAAAGVILTVLGICLSEPMLVMMGTPDNVLPLSAVYMKIFFAGMTFNMIYNFSASILRAAGDTKSPLLFLSIAGVINVVLNIFFVTVLHMNVAGVALATTISQAVSAVLVVIALMRRTDACKLELKKLRIYGPQLAKILRIGLPAGIQGSLFSVSNVLIQSSVNSFGDIFMSGNGAAGNIEGFIYVCMNSFSQTALNFVGQNFGAGQYARAKQAVRICLGSVIVVGLVLGCAAYAFSSQLLSIYIFDSAQAIAYGQIRMLYLCIPYFLCGLMDVASGALRGMGSSVAPMLITILGTCGIRIGWVMTIFQIPQYHTPECLFTSYAISWLVTFCCHMIAFHYVYKRYANRSAITK